MLAKPKHHIIQKPKSRAKTKYLKCLKGLLCGNLENLISKKTVGPTALPSNSTVW